MNRRFVRARSLLLVLGLALMAGLATDGPAQADASSAPRLAITPARLSFSAVGEVQTLTFTNVGGGVLHTGNMSFVTTGPRAVAFILDAPGPRELAPGASTIVSVTYHPAGAAPAQAFAALLVPTDAPGLPPDRAMRVGTPATPRVAGVALAAGETSLLGWIIFLPLLGAGLLQLVPASRPRLARSVALVAAGVPLALAALAVGRFDPTLAVADGNHGLQLVAHAPLLRALAVEYFVGVDGVSVLLVLLAPLVTLAAVAGTRTLAYDGRARATLGALLLAQTGATGAFVALDGVLLTLFWLLALAATAAATATQMDARAPAQARARTKTGAMVAAVASAALLGLGLVALHGHASPGYLADGTPTSHTFDLLQLARANDFARKGLPGLFGLSFVACVRGGLFVACLIALASRSFGIVAVMGLYGLARLDLSVLPETTGSVSTLLATLGVLAALHAALLSTKARDLDGLFANTATARMALGVVGLATLGAAGVTGALVLVLGQGLVTTLFLALRPALGDRAASLAALEGLSSASPRLAHGLAFALFASVGVPGLVTFAGTALVVLDASARHPAVALGAIVAWVVTTGAHVRVLRSVFASSSHVSNPSNLSVSSGAVGGRDLGGAELALVLPVAVLLLALGLAPAPILNTVAASVGDLLRLVTHAKG